MSQRKEHTASTRVSEDQGKLADAIACPECGSHDFEGTGYFVFDIYFNTETGNEHLCPDGSVDHMTDLECRRCQRNCEDLFVGRFVRYFDLVERQPGCSTTNIRQDDENGIAADSHDH